MKEESPPLNRISANESEDDAFVQLGETLRNLQEKYFVHGHGVSDIETATSIQEHGLYTAWSTLQDLTHELSNDPSSAVQQLHGWNYEARQYIVLIAVPKHEDYHASDVANEERSAWENRERSRAFAAKHVFEFVKRPEELHTPLKADKRIPPKRIIGYWDDINKAFHPNPYFEE